MNEINKTLYIPLYGKATVSKKGIILNDTKAEEIWEKEGFELHGKSKSKWLTYYMAMRAKVFDDWTKAQLQTYSNAIVLHIGCGMDSRIERISNINNLWYDIDFPQVIEERKKYYNESNNYKMFCADASKTEWLSELPKVENAIVIMEGIGMYLTTQQLSQLFIALQKQFKRVNLLADFYTVFGAKASKYKNPINDVGITSVSGLDEPKLLEENNGIQFINEKTMTPPDLINQLKGFERMFFKVMFGGKFARKTYRLYEYEIINEKLTKGGSYERIHNPTQSH
ncbi:MAG: class I SAM-dependent methyltransferase [Acutalibacteraceae bacterium]|nr:class I SAM-dependent methyltransferase [Acutalibacteraceae bacterium]